MLSLGVWKWDDPEVYSHPQLLESNNLTIPSGALPPGSQKTLPIQHFALKLQQGACIRVFIF